MRLSENRIQQIVNKIVEGLHPEKVVLFGSYAAGSATDDSDLDLLVVMNSDKPSYKRSAAVRSLLGYQFHPKMRCNTIFQKRNVYWRQLNVY